MHYMVSPVGQISGAFTKFSFKISGKLVHSQAFFSTRFLFVFVFSLQFSLWYC